MSVFHKNAVKVLGLWLGLFVGLGFSESAFSQEQAGFAVLPLLNQTGNPEYDWIGEGYADLLSSRLATEESVKVTSRREIEEKRKRAKELKKTATADLKEINLIFPSPSKPLIIIYGDYRLQKNRFHFKIFLSSIKEKKEVKSFQFQTAFLELLPAFDRNQSDLCRSLGYKTEGKNEAHDFSAFVNYSKSWAPYLRKDYPAALSYCVKALVSDGKYLSALYRMEDIYEKQSSWEQAYDIYLKLEEIFKQRKEPVNLLHTYQKLAAYYKKSDQFPYEVRYHKKILLLIKRYSLKASPSKQYIAVADAYHKRGMFDQAFKFYTIAMKRLVQTGNRHLIARTLAKLGDVFVSKKIDNRALRFYTNALKNLKGSPRAGESIFQSRNDRKKVIVDYDLEARLYTEIGSIYYGKRKYDKAIKFYNKSLGLKEQITDKTLLPRIYNEIGKIYLVDFQNGRALESFKTALKLAGGKELTREEQIETYNNIAVIYREKRDYKEAIKHYKIILKLEKKAGNRKGTGDCYMKIGQCYQAMKDSPAALKNYRQSLAIKKQSRSTELDMTDLIELHAFMGDLYLEQDNFPKASDHYFRLVDINRTVKDNSNLAGAYIRLARLHEIRGKKYLSEEELTSEKRESAEHEFRKAVHYTEMAVHLERTGRMGKKYFGGHDLVLRLLKGAVPISEFKDIAVMSKLLKGHVAIKVFGNDKLAGKLLESRKETKSVVIKDERNPLFTRVIEPVIIRDRRNPGYVHFDPYIKNEKQMRRRMDELNVKKAEAVISVWKKSSRNKILTLDQKNRGYVHFNPDILYEDQLVDRLKKLGIQKMDPVAVIWKGSRKGKVLERDESDDDYVYFTHISSQGKLESILRKAGIKDVNKVHSIVKLWRESVQVTDPNYFRDLHYLKMLKGEIPEESAEEEEVLNLDDLQVGSDEDFLQGEEEELHEPDQL
ncbi:MAG: tetratricopeptide repeat protein [bacterium]